ncbi:hypothetical protein K2173_026918 [Erythroxylum novogranatense]|uniref:Uncharacterized protein n=1 Tax=Erythroxylum novogranatense TaxID=1862640 RepID=A0AAV8TXL1_9ROSI|nr:hypothetical protein K2173_026918 [Erythroxylum novogranatense]
MLAPGKKLPDSHVKLWDHAERLSGSCGDINFGTRARKAAENFSKYMSEEGEESGVSTPPLWRNSPTTSPQHRYNHYRSMSPSSRAQAIARGQRELMEMVSRMPEGCYELSLKDIVEHPRVDVKQESSSAEKSITKAEAMRRRSEKSERKALINRSGSIDNGGFLLKMVFPLSWGSRDKKKKISTMTESAKDGRVSPRPLLFDGPAKGVDDEWWKRRHSDSAGNESGGFSSNSGSSKSSASSSSRSSSRNSSIRHTSGGCCPFIFIKKGKSG